MCLNLDSWKLTPEDMLLYVHVMIQGGENAMEERKCCVSPCLRKEGQIRRYQDVKHLGSVHLEEAIRQVGCYVIHFNLKQVGEMQRAK
ncbi:MAG: hypothetical protein LBD43_02810 [Holosporales bacterium]|jgi:hypothetical protein|nr:hypothetical protein [Holosporales bacterium]